MEVARSGSINATAQQLFISQQGVSDALKRMEQELGVKLLNRSKTGISLTFDGEQIYRYAQEVVEAYDKIEAYILGHQAGREEDSVLSILTNPMSMSAFMPEFLERLESVFSFSDLHCSDIASLEKMKQQVEGEDVDFGIFMLLQNDEKKILTRVSEKIKVYRLFVDELVACVSKNHPLAKHKSISATAFNQAKKVICDGAYSSELYTDSEAEYVTNNMDFQLNLLLKKNVVAVSTRYFFSKTFPEDAIAALPIKPAYKVCYYVMLPVREQYNEKTFKVLQILDHYVEEITGQKAEYNLNEWSIS